MPFEGNHGELSIDTTTPTSPITICSPALAVHHSPNLSKSLPANFHRVSTYPPHGQKSRRGILPLPKPSILKAKPFYASDTLLGHASSHSSLEDGGGDLEDAFFFNDPHIDIRVGGTNVDDLVNSSDSDKDSGLEGTSFSDYGDLSPNSEAVLVESTTAGANKFQGVIEIDRPPSPPLPHKPQRRNSIKSRACLLGIEQPLRRAHSFSQKKKGVKFLDEDGIHELTIVHLCEEPNDCPPTLRNPNVLKLLDLFFPEDKEDYCSASTVPGEGGAGAGQNAQSQCSKTTAYSHNIAEQIWQLNFEQPASNYATFRSRLSRCNVALENAMLRTCACTDSTMYGVECQVMGSIKVHNLAFHKTVTVRWTKNHWISYQDEPANWSTSDNEAKTDTFLVRFRIPSDDATTHRIEFCIRYVATGVGEFWDNNDSKNYVILSRSAKLLWG